MSRFLITSTKDEPFINHLNSPAGGLRWLNFLNRTHQSATWLPMLRLAIEFIGQGVDTIYV